MMPTDQEFANLRHAIQKICGIWLGDDKKYLIRSRLEPLLHKHKLRSYGELLLRIAGHHGHAMQEEITEAITTNETSFNRDGHPFEEFRRTILPDLIRRRLERQNQLGLPFSKLRIWSAAASTGQEAYSLGIAIVGYVQTQPRDSANRFLATIENFQILGTDISNHAIQVARLGRYLPRELDRGIGPELKQTYFTRVHDQYEVIPQVKNLVEFKQLNLVQPVPDLSLFDMILCRNLLIYFDEATRNGVIDQLGKRLHEGGVMMLGASESVATMPAGFVQEIAGRTAFYRKISTT